jgi:hypothetical protein
MSQTLLFVIGAVVFAITIVGTMAYGYFLFNRAYQVDLAGQAKPSDRAA